MPVLIPYSLIFQGGLRVGTRGVNLAEAGLPVPSDTLFAALVDACRRSGEDPQSLLAPFLEQPPDPPFLLTSAFPVAGQVRFYPMPVDSSRLFSRDTLAARGKSLRRIRYFSQALLEKALSGQVLDDWLYPEKDSVEPERGIALHGGSLWLAAEEVNLLPESFRLPIGRRRALRTHQVWAETEVPRVTVDRLGSASAIYHSGRISFATGCGLWFGVQWRKSDEPSQGLFDRCLNMLQEDGLGGERSAGYGAFRALPGPSFSLPDAGPGQDAYLLSRYHPRVDELPEALTAPGTAYQLVAVGGWLRSPDGPAQRRKRVHLAVEGSLLRFSGTWAGDLAEVAPAYHNPAGDLPHPVYRCGLALAAGWKQKEVSHA